MKRCCECKKFLWLWNRSNLSISIHRDCHQKLLDKETDANIIALMKKELSSLPFCANVKIR